jgi:hypothetical protein
VSIRHRQRTVVCEAVDGVERARTHITTQALYYSFYYRQSTVVCEAVDDVQRSEALQVSVCDFIVLLF